MAATALCSHSGELEVVQLYHGHGRKELLNTLTILQSFSVLFFFKESLPLFIDFKEGRTQTGSKSQNEFGFLRLLEFWKNEWIYLIQWIYLISFIPFFQQVQCPIEASTSKRVEICFLQELKHFPIPHIHGWMLEMLPMHIFKHMSFWKLVEDSVW